MAYPRSSSQAIHIRVRSRAFTLVEIMIVVLIIGILLAIAMPNFMQARESARARACIGNLKQIDTAKQEWLMDNKCSDFGGPSSSVTTTQASFSQLVPTYIRSTPTCPESGVYTLGTASTLPICMTGSVVTGSGNNPMTPHELT